MSKITYKIDFYSDWLCSSGLTGQSDNLPVTNRHELPYIPGKTLKGLIREAAKHLEKFSEENWEGMIRECFGYVDKEGQCFFSNAQLSQRVQKSITKRQKKLLFRNISSTQIDDEGQAVDNSLRSVTVVVPLTLFAEIENCPHDYVEKMKKCLMWVKHIGCLRNKGFGRCKLESVAI